MQQTPGFKNEANVGVQKKEKKEKRCSSSNDHLRLFVQEHKSPQTSC